MGILKCFKMGVLLLFGSRDMYSKVAISRNFKEIAISNCKCKYLDIFKNKCISILIYGSHVYFRMQFA